jgi:hypothetical protein
MVDLGQKGWKQFRLFYWIKMKIKKQWISIIDIHCFFWLVGLNKRIISF